MNEGAPSSPLRRERLREVHLLQSAVAALDLERQIADYLTSRYLDYLQWLENGANANLRIYYSLRIPALILAATVPALIALDFGAVGRTITVVLGIVVAATTGVEHFLNSGQRWRHYRGTAELMKSEAWLYLELAGDYANYTRHDAAFATFVARAEALMREEVREYVSTIVSEQRKPAETNVPGEH